MPESTDVRTVRLLIADTDPTDQLLDDAQLASLLVLEGESVKLAAAQALDIIASSEALVAKVIRTQDLSTDGAKTADALRKHAVALRGQAAAAVDAVEEGWFEVVDVVGPDLTARWP